MITEKSIGYQIVHCDARDIRIWDKKLAAPGSKDLASPIPIANPARRFLCWQLGISGKSTDREIMAAMLTAGSVAVAVKTGKIRNITVAGCVNNDLDTIRTNIMNLSAKFGIEDGQMVETNGLSHVLLRNKPGHPWFSIGHNQILTIGPRVGLSYCIGEYGNAELAWNAFQDIDTADWKSNGPTKEHIVKVLKSAERYFEFVPGTVEAFTSLKIAGCMDKAAMLKTLGDVKFKMRRPNSISAGEKALRAKCTLYSKLTRNQ